MKHYYLAPLGLLLGVAATPALAQTAGVGIGTTAPDASAALDIVSSGKGVLLPRVADATAIASPAPGLLVYQTGGAAGFYYNAGTAATPSWQQLATAAGAAVTATNGLTRTGSAIGLGGTLIQTTTIANAGFSLALTGTGNVGIGTASPVFKLQVAGTTRVGLTNGNFSLYNNSVQSGTVLLGALDGTSAGAQLRFSGAGAGYMDIGQSSTGSFVVEGTDVARLTVQNAGNVGIGTTTPAYLLDVAGAANAGTGLRVGGNAVAYFYGGNLYLGTSNLPTTAPSGVQNTFVGTNAGLALTSGINNTVLGLIAGDALTTGSSNTFMGIQAGGSTTTGDDNVFIGHDPGLGNVSGSSNVGIGHNALANVTADDNVAIGDAAGTNVTTGTFNTLLGSGANLSGSTQRSRATALGYNARVDQDDAVVLGDPTNVAVRTGLGTATPAAKLEVQGGADSDGSTDPVALAFSWHDGGFRHFVRSRHNGALGAGGNDLDFFLNNSGTTAGSSAPGTGNVQVLTLESNNGQPRAGVGTTAPTSTLQVAGSVAASIRTLGSGTIAATDYTVLVTGSVSLPAPAAGNAGRLYHLLNGGTGNPVVTGTFRDAGTAGTFSSFTLGTGSGGKGITVQSDGTQWWILTRE